MERNAPINGDPGDTVAMKNPMTGGVDFPGKMAANKFANIKELVLMMGDHVPDGVLPRLCCVNRDFNALFSPRLYRHVRLNERLLQPNAQVWGAGNQRFLHIKILSFKNTSQFNASAVPGYEPVDGPSQGSLPEDISALIQRTATGILRHSPALHTLHTAIGSDKAILIINNGFNGRSQRSSTKLQCLVLNLSPTPCRELSASVFQKQCLKSLCLAKIPTESWTVSSLCLILKESPELRYLKLSYLNGAEHQWRLEAICKQYSQLGGIPLKLEIMILGGGVNLKLPERALSSIPGGDPSAQAFYLALLTDPTCLQEMKIIATGATALGTFDSSFFPNLNLFRLRASIRHEQTIRNFFAKPKTRDFLRQVHFQVGGSLFRNYRNFKDMTRRFFGLCDLNDPTSRLAPMGFSFHSKLQSEDLYVLSVALPLPTTRVLDVTIHYRHLVGFSGKGLSEMSALECLSLSVYVSDISEWDDVRIIGEKQLKVLGKATNSCPNLRYVRMKMGDTGPVSAAIAGLSCSGEIIWERRPRFKKLKPVFKELDVEADKFLRPQSMWTDPEKRAQYVEEDLDELVYHKPVCMERIQMGATGGVWEQQ